MIQRIPEATCLIPAYESHIVAVMETHGFQIAEDFTVMGFGSLDVLDLFLLIGVASKSKTFLVNIHSDVNCGILHVMTSFCMR
jgi:hypothetical protein